jgi:branched-chain amino acid transport system substrate-binding protein
MMMLAQAIRNAKSAEPAAIRDAVESIRGFHGTGGEFTFSADDHAGLSEEAFAMVRITKGDWELLR